MEDASTYDVSTSWIRFVYVLPGTLMFSLSISGHISDILCVEYWSFAPLDASQWAPILLSVILRIYIVHSLHFIPHIGRSIVAIMDIHSPRCGLYPHPQYIPFLPPLALVASASQPTRTQHYAPLSLYSLLKYYIETYDGSLEPSIATRSQPAGTAGDSPLASSNLRMLHRFFPYNFEAPS
jgi:hypothetical protein